MTPFTPSAVLTVDVGIGASPDDPAVIGDGDCSRSFVLLTMCGEPLGTASVTHGASASVHDLVERLEAAVAAAETRHGHSACSVGGECRWRAAVEEVRRRAEPISIVLCTAGRPASLDRTLRALLQLDYPDFEVVVVDNTPDDVDTRKVVRSFERGGRAVQYVSEPRRGLSRARNAGVRNAAHDVIAFTDDDILPGPGWLMSIALAFHNAPTASIVTGPVLPAELETPAQELFELQGGHSKGRGFARTTIRPWIDQSPLFPLPPFAVGANMTFRREALESVGGFDEALGAGTRAKASEDTHAIAEVMLRGHDVAYEPGVLIWHFHRRDMHELLTQRANYGRGVGAFYTALLAREPARLWQLIKLIPTSYHAVRHSVPIGVDSRGSADHTSSSIKLAELARGPIAYVRGRRDQRTGSAT